MSDHSLYTATQTAAVRSMYEVYPYPSPNADDSVIDDVANGLYALFGEHELRGSRILDAGCGTGHRIVAVAKRYPDAHVVGVDMTAASLRVAKRLADQHKVRNVQFQQANLLDLDLPGQFDVVICTGVLVCLEDAEKGLHNLARLLTRDGVMFVWLYNAVGEHERMLQRELLQLMWGTQSGLQHGVELMQEMDLKLAARQYGSASAVQRSGQVSQLNIDVDAFLHPIVNVYRLDEGICLFRRCKELGWAAIHSVNAVGTSTLIDLAEAEHSELRYFCQKIEDLFPKESLRQRFRELDKMTKLRVMELKLRPTGFTIIGGRNRSYAKLGSRITGNAIEL